MLTADAVTGADTHLPHAVFGRRQDLPQLLSRTCLRSGCCCELWRALHLLQILLALRFFGSTRWLLPRTATTVT